MAVLKWRLLVGVGVCGCLIQSPAQAHPNTAAEAEAAYQRGLAIQDRDPAAARARFRAAAQYYEQLLHSGHDNSRLYLNLGHAYLQSGDVARAVLNYRRAERLTPRDQRVQESLAQVARLLGNESAPARPWWLLYGTGLGWVSPSCQLGAGLAGYFLGWLPCGYALRSRRKWPLWLGLPVTLIGSVWAGTATWQLYYDAAFPRGVVCALPSPLGASEGPNFRSTCDRTLRPGVEFRLVSANEEWLNIRLEDGTTGWLLREEAVLDLDDGRVGE
jgi:tetratricopeptide (TPR) repeat protein